MYITPEIREAALMVLNCVAKFKKSGVMNGEDIRNFDGLAKDFFFDNYEALEKIFR